MLELLKNNRILVVVAHPDDEILGVGATINKIIKEYNSLVRVVILGEGLTSRANNRDTIKWQKQLETHRKNILDAKKLIGYDSLGIYNFPDNRFDDVNLLDIVKVIEKEKKDFEPTVIFTHHHGDLNIDHQRTFQAVVTATRPMQNECVKAVVSLETPSATEWNYGRNNSFIPNLWIEISEQNLLTKQKAMKCYEFETRDYPHPRSLKALKSLAEKRGIEAGFELAEAFEIVRYSF